MDKFIKSILDDLYMLDKNLMEKEKDLIPIIKTLIDIKPDTGFDNQFKNELKSRLMEQINTDMNIKNQNKSGFNLNMFVKYFVGSVSVTCIGVFTFMYFFDTNSFRSGTIEQTGMIYKNSQQQDMKVLRNIGGFDGGSLNSISVPGSDLDSDVSSDSVEPKKQPQPEIGMLKSISYDGGDNSVKTDSQSFKVDDQIEQMGDEAMNLAQLESSSSDNSIGSNDSIGSNNKETLDSRSFSRSGVNEFDGMLESEPEIAQMLMADSVETDESQETKQLEIFADEAMMLMVQDDSITHDDPDTDTAMADNSIVSEDDQLSDPKPEFANLKNISLESIIYNIELHGFKETKGLSDIATDTRLIELIQEKIQYNTYNETDVSAHIMKFENNVLTVDIRSQNPSLSVNYDTIEINLNKK